MMEIVTQPSFDEDLWTCALDHVKVDDEALHPLIEQYLYAAIARVEACSGRVLYKRTIKLVVDGFEPEIVLSASPTIAVTAISYVDKDGATQDLDTAAYVLVDRLDTPKVIPARGHSWPVTADVPDAVSVTFDAGYGEEMRDIPAALRQAVLMTVADWFRFAGNVATAALHPLPDDAYRACLPFRRVWC